MLREQDQQLLTGLIDGELTSRQRRLAARLLRRSAEARQFFARLQADAHSLGRLPVPRLRVDLTNSVMESIAARHLTPGGRGVAGASAASSWSASVVPWAAAATVLLGLGTATYLSFRASQVPSTPKEIARTETVAPSPRSNPEQLGSSITASPTEEPKAKQQQSAVLPKGNKSSEKDPPIDKKQGDTENRVAVAQSPTPSKEDAPLTDRLELFQLERVSDVLPVVLHLKELERGAERKRLDDELRKDSSFRLELPCGHGTKAVERIMKAAAKLHYSLVIGKQAQERIKLKWPTSYVIYLENLTPEELTGLLRQIETEDRQASSGKKLEMQFDSLVLTRLTMQHRKELSTLLGIDPTAPEPTRANPAGAELHKPLPDKSLEKSSELSKDKGRAERQKPSKASEKTTHSGLVLAYNPVRPSPDSEEIRRFLSNRQPVRPGTIRVILVLRG